MARADSKTTITSFGAAAARSLAVPCARSCCFLIFISLALMILSRLHHSALTEMRWHVASSLAPVLQAATGPADLFREIGHAISSQFDLAAELQRLKAETRN